MFMRPQPTLQNFSISGKQLRRCTSGKKGICDGKTVWALLLSALLFEGYVSIHIEMHETSHKKDLARTKFLWD